MNYREFIKAKVKLAETAAMADNSVDLTSMPDLFGTLAHQREDIKEAA